MSSLDQFNILLERMETLDEMADSFKRAVKGAASGEDGLNLMLKAYRNERTGKPVGAISRVKNLIVLRALYDKDYLNDEQFQTLAKKATSSNYISNTLKEINPEAHNKLFGTAQESDDIIKHIKLNAKDMLNFGLTNLQGKTYVEVQEDEPQDEDAKELEDEVASEVISLAKGLTSDDVEGTILDFDDVDVALDGLENKDAITRKLVSILNGAGYTAEASGAGFNVEAPIGSFGTEEKVQDLMAGLILKHFPGADESLIDVKLNTTIEDAESFNEKPDLPGEIDPTRDLRTAGEEMNRDREEQELEDEMDDRLHTPASDEEDSLEAKIKAALDAGDIDEYDAVKIRQNAESKVEDAEGSIKQEVLNACKGHAGEFAHKAAGMAKACEDMYNQYGKDGDQERAEIAYSLQKYYETQSKFEAREDSEHIEDYETVTENFENQRHLNVTTNSTSMYLTEQVSKDTRNGSQNKKSSNQSQSFRERYKPKTSHQLAELRRYGL